MKAQLPYPNLFSVLVGGVIAVNYFSAFADLDFTWQIRSGERIVTTGELVPTEAFTYTIAGQRVSQFEWLYEVGLWAIWVNFGFGGLKLLRVILVMTPLLLLARRLQRDGVPWHGVALSLLAAIVIVAPAWNLRPLYCTTIGLLLVSGWLHEHCTGRQPLDWRLPIVMLLWGNLHPGVVTGQGLIAGAIGWEWINRSLRVNSPLGSASCRRLTLFGGLGLAATFVSPAPIARLLLPFQSQLAHPIQRAFSEMRPIYQVAADMPFLFATVCAVAVFTVVTIVCRFRHYRMWELALLLGLTGLGCMAVRCIQDWTLVSLALAVPHLTLLIRERVAERRLLGWSARKRDWLQPLLRLERSAKHVLDTRWLRFQQRWPRVVLVILAFLSVLPVIGKAMPKQEGAKWPTAALDWIESHGVQGRFFAPPDYGSYLAWRLRERGRNYVDTRGFLFPPELLEDSHYIPQLGPDWQSRLERVYAKGTDYFLLETTGARGLLWQTVQPHIAAPLYVDDKAVLLSASQLRVALATVSDSPQHFARAEVTHE